MLRTLNIGATGLNAQQLKVDVLANNLANTNTTGFKKGRAEFCELLSQELVKSGIPAPPDAKVGSGVEVAQVAWDFRSGDLIETGRKTDLAICGEGFFKVVRGNDVRYTRNGSFEIDKNGNMMTTAGYKLDGILFDPGTDRISLDSKGIVRGEGLNGTKEAGQIKLYNFTAADELRLMGENLFAFDGDAGQIISGTPGGQGLGMVRQGCLEAANVDLTEDMVNLLESQRALSFSARTVRSADEMWGIANNLRK